MARWMRMAVLLAAPVVMLGGCWDSNGKITGESVHDFWAKVGEDMRTGLGMRRAAWSSPLLPADLPSGDARPASRGPAHGTLFASRRENVLLVDVNLWGVSDRVKTVSTGLKLRDGTVLAPQSVVLLGDATQYRPSVPRADFDFGQGRGQPGQGEPARCLRVAYELPNAPYTVNGATFTVILGEPEGNADCTVGITSAVSMRDGGPVPAGCAIVEAPEGEFGPPMPLARAPTNEGVSFRFAETAGKASAASPSWVAAAVASADRPSRAGRVPVAVPADVP